MTPKLLAATLRLLLVEGEPILITGKPGIGKTDTVYQACKAVGYDMLELHPTTSDPTDYKGMPFVIKGEAMFIPFGDLKQMMEATEPLAVFFDDLGHVQTSVQAALMHLMLARKVNGQPISEHVRFVAASNMRGQKSGVGGMIEPMKSRFITIIEMQTDVDEWVEWALDHEIVTEVIAFIKFRRELLDDFKPTADFTNSPVPRTVTHVSKLLKMGLPQEAILETITGAAGEPFALEFVGFLKTYERLPNIKEALKYPKSFKIENDPAICYAFTMAIANLAEPDNMPQICELAKRMPEREYSNLMVMTARKNNPDVMNTKAFIQWAKDNNDVLI